MLEINFLQPENQPLTIQPAKFNLTQLENGNYVLSKFEDYSTLKSQILNWQKINSGIQDFQERYRIFVESNKKKITDIIQNYDFWINFRESLNYNDHLKSKLTEEFTFSLDVQIGKQFPCAKQKKQLKYPEGDRFFVEDAHSSLKEYSRIEKKIVYDFGNIGTDVISMTKSPDNMSLFVCSIENSLKEFNIFTHKEVNNFDSPNFDFSVVTWDNQFLLTCEDYDNCTLKKFSMKTKQLLYTWNGIIDKTMCSQHCSYDNRYQFLGYDCGWLGIFDIKNEKTIKNVQILTHGICSVAFTKDCLGAYISDDVGNFEMIRWISNAYSGADFKSTQNRTHFSGYHEQSLCLTKNDKNLIAVMDGTLSIVSTRTKKIIFQIKSINNILHAEIIKDGTKALIVEKYGSSYIIDLETMKLSSFNESFSLDYEIFFVVIL